MSIDTTTISQKTTALLKMPFYSENGVVKTPLIFSKALSELSGSNVYLKCENLQTTGSFKIRGATSALLNLSDSDRAKGVLTASSGNHGAATAAAAKSLDIPVSIYVPSSISPMKEAKILKSGAELIKVDGQGENAEREAARVAKEDGLTFISPYNHADIVAGQGSIVKELLTDLPDVDAVFISVGGGGLISGIGSNMKTAKPETEIVGVWPAHADAMLECMKANEIVEIIEKDTLSDGTAGGIEAGSITLPLCQQVIDSKVLVSETEIAEAMKLLYREHDFVTEGAAGVALAGLLKDANKYQGKNVVIVLCGKNITEELFNLAMQMVEE